MAVTINEMQVEMQDPPQPANVPAAESKPAKSSDLRSELEMIRERKLRLQAD
ncbi:MAG: hypothetical protein WCC87_04615 [Candidatus Korobacteraceae bacterium]